MAPSSQAEQDLEQAVRAYCIQYAASHEDAAPIGLLCNAVKGPLRTLYGTGTGPFAQLKAFLRSKPDTFAIINRQVNSRSWKFVVCFGVASGAAPAAHARQNSTTYCSLCRRQCTSTAQYQQHINSSAHRAQQLQRLFLQQGGLHANNAADGLMVSTLPELEGLLPNEAYLQQLLVTNVGTQPQLLVSCAQMRALPEISISGGEGKRLQVCTGCVHVCAAYAEIC